MSSFGLVDLRPGDESVAHGGGHFAEVSAPEDADRECWKSTQGHDAERAFAVHFRDGYAEADTELMADVDGDEILRTGFHRGLPNQAAACEFAVKQPRKEFVVGEAHEGKLAGRPGGEKRFHRTLREGAWDEQAGAKFREAYGAESRRQSGFEDRDGEVRAAVGDQLLRAALVDFVKCHGKPGKAHPQLAEQGRDMTAHHLGQSRQTQTRSELPAQEGFHVRKAGEKRTHEVVERAPGVREDEGSSREQRHAERFLEGGELGADGGLLDAIRNLAARGGDAFEARDVVEEFEVVDVHID